MVYDTDKGSKSEHFSRLSMYYNSTLLSLHLVQIFLLTKLHFVCNDLCTVTMVKMPIMNIIDRVY